MNALCFSLEEYLPAQGQVPLEVLNGVMAAYGRHGYFSFARRILETVRFDCLLRFWRTCRPRDRN